MKIGKYWIKPGSIADSTIKIWLCGTVGLVFGGIFAIGMNIIHPIF